MKSNVKWRLLAVPAVLLMAGIPALGCDQIAGATDTLCCKDFKVGADLSAVDWDITGEGKATFGAFMQATADFAGTTTASVTEVGAACQAIAQDLGDKTEVKETDNAKRTTAWCNLAVAQINAKLSGKVSVVAQPPTCSFNANVQANCEAKCTADVNCEAELGDIAARCEPGMLSGKCSAECTGTCEGSANLAVTCNGTCDGTCEGTCEGTCSRPGTGPKECRGACQGNCDGECRGSCEIAAMGKATCEGDCTGSCSVDFVAPKCKVELKPPSAKCQGSAECSGSCKASASAKAECTAPSIEVLYNGQSSAEVNLQLASLRLNLPKILVAFQGKGPILLANAKALVDVTGSFVSNAKDLSVKAGLCAIPAGEALATAATNLQVTVTASTGVMKAVGM